MVHNQQNLLHHLIADVITDMEVANCSHCCEKPVETVVKTEGDELNNLAAHMLQCAFPCCSTAYLQVAPVM